MSKIKFENDIYISINGIRKAGPFSSMSDAKAYVDEIDVVPIYDILEKISHDHDWDEIRLERIKKVLNDENLLKSGNGLNAIEYTFLREFKDILNSTNEDTVEIAYKIIINMLRHKLKNDDIADASILLYNAFLKPYVDAKRRARNYMKTKKFRVE